MLCAKCVMVVDKTYEDKSMRTGNLMIVAITSVGFLSPLSVAQVVLDMPKPAPKASPVKAKDQPTATTVVSASASTNSTSSSQSQLRDGDIALKRYVRARSGPQYTSGMYNYRRYGYGYGYGYGYYSPFFFGFGGVHHHHHHNDSHGDKK